MEWNRLTRVLEQTLGFVSSSRDFNLGRSTNTFDQLIRKKKN
jgi:hypothetical protein